jgi:hypothetical protein
MADGVTKPMRVDTSLLHGIAAANNAAAAQTRSSSLKSTGTTTSFSSALKSAAENETTKPVEGQPYAEILTGPRAGMYLNTGGGSRDGQAFILVKHDGREDHIYGTGKDRKVVSVVTDPTADKTSSPSSSSAPKAPAGETTKHVHGHRYADIITGPRKGLYLNTSGNSRDGRAFTLVRASDREFHIYGTGEDRLVITVMKHKAPAPTDTPTTDAADTTTPTGTTDNGQIVTDAATTG